MSVRFDPRDPLIVVPGIVGGPTGSWGLTLAVDTGATQTIISPTVLVAAGYDPAAWGPAVWIVGATGGAHGREVTIRQLSALNWRRDDVSVLAQQLPAGLRVDGLLGLDFFRDHILTIDFLHNEIDMSPGPSASATP
ncbi:MAG: retropepsin-like domain-containing protein [Zavarzinella sp.]|nr:retropepsin-like domain-containing protein [Zavarzinella sp.]